MASITTHRPPRSSGSGETRRGDDGPKDPSRRRFLIGAGAVAGTIAVFGAAGAAYLFNRPRGGGPAAPGEAAGPALGNMTPREQEIYDVFLDRINHAFRNGQDVVNQMIGINPGPVSDLEYHRNTGYLSASWSSSAGTVHFAVGPRTGPDGYDKADDYLSDPVAFREEFYEGGDGQRIARIDSHNGSFHLFTPTVGEDNPDLADLHMQVVFDLESGNPFEGRPYGVTHDSSTMDAEQTRMVLAARGMFGSILDPRYFGNAGQGDTAAIQGR